MTFITGKATRLRIGFVPLTDCAPLVVAKETGLFAKFDLNVRLSRELGWGSIRGKLALGELDAAHALAALLAGSRTSLAGDRSRCVTGLVLSLNGDGITLSERLWSAGARDAVSFRAHLTRQRGNPAVLGVPALFSSHFFLLRKWLADAKIDIDQDVRVVALPPQQMSERLKSGHLDGYCVGEPWNSVAIRQGAGWCAATSGEIFPFHPEKALVVSEQFADKQHHTHLRLIAALIEACHYCDQPGNSDSVVSLLAMPQYINVPADILKNGFSGSFDYGHGKRKALPDFAVFSRHDANIPSYDKAAWLARQVARGGLVSPVEAGRRSAFRSDLFEQAMELVSGCARRV
jgi:ABC-type nitrate/sulfonate/bicarbonate transport system substrate-binding protein